LPLSSYSLTFNNTWFYTKNVPPFQPLTQGPDTVDFNLNALDLTAYTDILSRSLTLTAGLFTDVNFNVFQNLVGDWITASKALTLVLATGGDSTAIASLGASSANGLSWFLAGTTPTLVVPAGGFFMFSLRQGMTPQALTMIAGSMRVTNTGTGTLTANLFVLCGP
jgi:hypothetical protein